MPLSPRVKVTCPPGIIKGNLERIFVPEGVLWAFPWIQLMGLLSLLGILSYHSPGLELQLQEGAVCSHWPSPGCSWRALAQVPSQPGLSRKLVGVRVSGQAKQGSSLLLSLLPQCQSIQHPLRGPHQCQKEQWVTKGWLKCRERKDGIWNSAQVCVWVTPFLFTLQKRSPCVHPPAHKDIPWHHHLAATKLTPPVQALCKWFQADMGSCSSPGCCSELVRDQAHAQRCHRRVQSAAQSQQEVSTASSLPSSLIPEIPDRTLMEYPGVCRA